MRSILGPPNVRPRPSVRPKPASDLGNNQGAPQGSNRMTVRAQIGCNSGCYVNVISSNRTTHPRHHPRSGDAALFSGLACTLHSMNLNFTEFAITSVIMYITLHDSFSVLTETLSFSRCVCSNVSALACHYTFLFICELLSSSQGYGVPGKLL